MYTEVNMKELLIAIAQGLVEDPTAVNVDVDDSAGAHRKGDPRSDACRSNPHQQQDFCRNRLSIKRRADMRPLSFLLSAKEETRCASNF